MTDTIFSYATAQSFFRTYLGEDFQPTHGRYEPNEFEVARYQQLKKEITESKQREFGFLTDLVGNEEGPQLWFPVNADNFFPHGENLRLNQFLGSIHPHYLQVYLWWGTASYMLAAMPQLRQMVQLGMEMKYVFALPLCKNIDQPENQHEYEWWQQKSEVIKISPSKRILAHLNRYTYFHSFQNGMQSGAIFSDIEQENATDKMLVDFLKQQLIPALMAFIPANEAKVFKAYLDGCQSTLEVSKATQYTSTTVRTYANRLLTKLNPPFPLFPFREFTTLKKAAELLNAFVS